MAKKSLMFTIKLKNQTITLTPKQGKSLYKSLHEIFSGKENQALPLFPDTKKEG